MCSLFFAMYRYCILLSIIDVHKIKSIHDYVAHQKIRWKIKIINEKIHQKYLPDTCQEVCPAHLKLYFVDLSYLFLSIWEVQIDCLAGLNILTDFFNRRPHSQVNYWSCPSVLTCYSTVQNLLIVEPTSLHKHVLNFVFAYIVGGSICEPLMQTTTAGRVMLIHQLVSKGNLQELKKELAKDMGWFLFTILLMQCLTCHNMMVYMYYFFESIPLAKSSSSSALLSVPEGTYGCMPLGSKAY